MSDIIAWILSLFGLSGSATLAAPAVPTSGGTTAASLSAAPAANRWAKVQSIIAARIAASNVPDFDLNAAFLMADMENGIAEGLWDAIFQNTNSLYNRHQGLGIVGVPNSDGIWTGRIYYASADDPNLRVYASLEDSADDFLLLMQNPVYADVLTAARSNDLPGFIAAVAAVPYSTQGSYAAALAARARSLGLS